MFHSSSLLRILLVGTGILGIISQSAVLASPTWRVPDIDVSVQRIERSRLSSRQDVSPTEYFAWYTSLGDSFSAGPSAGNQRNVDSDDYDCSRYDQAFPMQLSTNDDVEGTKTLQFLACTGGKMPDVMSKQLPLLSARVDLITLTIGGNDVGFGSILNNCIYKIKPSTWTCQATIDWAKSTMQSSEFADAYSNILQTIWDKDPLAHVYVLGYPTFFQTASDQCSSTCFKFGAPCENGDYLTPEWRGELNDLTTSLNSVIQSIVLRNPSPLPGGLIEFVDPNPGYNGHRFCEDGVTEPNYDNPNTWFYPFTWFKRDYWTSTFDSSICDNLDTADSPYTGELGVLIACGFLQNATLQSIADADDSYASATYPDPDEIGTAAWLPACFQRIFHPTILGMTSFMEDVVNAIHAPDPANIAPTVSAATTSSVVPVTSSVSATFSTPATSSAPAPTPAPTTSYLCNLGNYPDPTMGPINDGMGYLKGMRGTQFCVAANSCGRPSCSYGTGISVCNDQDVQICVDLGDIGDQAYAAQQACGVDTTCTTDFLVCGYDGFEACCEDTVAAFQSFETSGYNILVDGGFDC